MAPGKHTLIKFCGFTRSVDVEHACQLNVDALGFIFAQDAKTPLSLTAARELLRAARGAGLQRIAVVGTMPLDDCKRILDLGFDAVQRVATDACPTQLGGRPVLPVFFDHPHVAKHIERAVDGQERDSDLVSSTVCLDGPRGGGRGIPPDWERARHIAQHVPLLLAGGLQARNVADAISTVHPRGVDVSSGIESQDGSKDPDRMAAFVAAVRGVC